MYNKSQLIKIYEDTVRISKQTMSNTETKKYTFKDIYLLPKDKRKGEVLVENSDTITSTIKYSLKGKTCMLNMASPKRPGGGVSNGARAQEECLFRSTNLSEHIPSSLYPLSNYDAIYTKNALILKDGDYGLINTPIEVDCVTIAALNLNKVSKKDIKWFTLESQNDFEVIKGYEGLTKMKIRLMLSLAHRNGNKNIILGAWGCGVFGNHPKEMSQMFYDVLYNEEMRLMFDNVVFSVINDNNSTDDNYTIFRNKFN